MSVPTKPPTFKTIDWGAMVRRIAGDDFHKPDVGYRFEEARRSPREFNDSGPGHGLYAGTGT